MEADTATTYFKRATRSRLRPSPVLLVLVDIINPMQFPGAQNLVPAALRAAQPTASLKKRLRALGVTAI